MARKRYKVEETLGKLRQDKVLIDQDWTVAGTCREIGAMEITYFRGPKEHRGLKLDHAPTLKERKKENSRLKRAKAMLSSE